MENKWSKCYPLDKMQSTTLPMKSIPVSLVVSRREIAKIHAVFGKNTLNTVAGFPQIEAGMSHTSCELNSNQAGG